MSLSRRVPVLGSVSSSFVVPRRYTRALAASVLLAAATLAGASAPVRAQSGATTQPAFGGAAFQGLASDVFDDADGDYRLGLGFNVQGFYTVHPFFDVRADVGFRWIEGQSTTVLENAEPELGGRPGETIHDLRIMPFTVGFVYRIEQWSQGRFWVPYVSAGLGYYDMRAEFLDEAGEERHDNLFKVGYHGRAGVNFHRTSGLFLNLEAAVHAIDTDRRVTPLYDVSIGVGTVLPMPR